MEIVEIILASYNGKEYIREQIDSILNQDTSAWHLTVSDDDSTDGTDVILDEYVKKYPEKIKRVYSGKKFGNARDHFFWLMEQCEAEYIAFSDQDDVFFSKKIRMLFEKMKETESQIGKTEPILVFSDQEVVNADLSLIAPSLMRYQKQYFECFDYRSIFMQNVVTGGAMMINRALANWMLQCAEKKETIMHDWWAACVASRFGKIVYIDEPLGVYRQHGKNSVGAKNVRGLAHILRKLSRLSEVRETIQKKKMQADVFLRTFDEKLTLQDRAFFMQMKKERSGFLFYWKNRKVIHGFFRWAGMVVLG